MVLLVVVAVLVVRGLGAGHAMSVAVKNRSRAARNDQAYAATLRLAEDHHVVVAGLEVSRAQV
ncbi:MAG: hypothetical protein Q4G45_02645 [Actinomycetia bacterium]|nr:hypothetical protein [Actinomycetes bacterium]